MAGADLLIPFADALVAHDEEALAALRAPMIEALGPAGFLEAATVAANFQRMVRIADGTGIPQDDLMMTLGGDVVDELSLRDFASAGHTPALGWLGRLVGPVLRPFAPRLLAWAARRMNDSPRRGGGTVGMTG